MAAVKSEVRLLTGGGVDSFVHHRLAHGVALVEGSQDCFESPRHSLRDAVALRVIRGGVVQCYASAPAELLEGVGSELPTIVKWHSVRGPKVCDEALKCLSNLIRVLCFERIQFCVPTVMI